MKGVERIAGKGKLSNRRRQPTKAVASRCAGRRTRLSKPAIAEMFRRFQASDPHPKSDDGYDSVVHLTPACPRQVRRGLTPALLARFNGARGFEMLSEASVTVNRPRRVWLRCGLGLRREALWEHRLGRGRLIVNRVQVRGRLIEDSPSPPGEFPARSPDSAAQRLLLNLLGAAARG